MTLVRVRRDAQLALPADVRRALNVLEGDFLEAEIVPGGVLLKAAGTVEKQRAWERIGAAVAQVTDAELSEQDRGILADEEAIADTIRAYRRQNA